MNRVRIWRRDSSLLLDADQASCCFDRLRGLLGRSTLPDTEGLLLVPCCAIHTFGMSVSIDVVFLTNLGKVLAVREQVIPHQIAFKFAASQVLEVAAGSVARWDLRLDEQLHMEVLDGC